MTTNDSNSLEKGPTHGHASEPAPHFYSVRLSDHDAWFGTTIAVLFNGLGMLLESAIIRRVPGISLKLPLMSAGVALLLLVVLFHWRKRPSAKWASVIFLVNATSVNVVLQMTNLQFAALETNWSPFQATKLGSLIAAMVAPGFWVGMLDILGSSLCAVLQLEFFFPPDIRAQLVTEPWPTLAFALAGILALIYRFRRAQLEQELSRAQAQNFAIRRLASAFLNIRDLMNTPLQVIEFSVGLLRDSKQPPQPIIDRIDRSVQNLREINTMLVEHEKEIEWQTHKKK